jgi:hypothetical protein
MFGLSDNNDNKYADTTQLSASDAASSDQSPPAGATGPLPSTSAPASGYGSATPVAGSASNAAAAVSPPLSPASPISSGGMGDVSLDNAYIATDPPVKPKDQNNSSQPTAASLVNGGGDDELLKLKQQALQSLAPLVDHLEQDPEEKFKTTMMMIQASDNADLIPEAYEAANKISDEKVRAQALLDVVNEINYFTQHANNTPQHPAD